MSGRGRFSLMASILGGLSGAGILLVLLRLAGRGLTTADYLVAAILAMVAPALYVLQKASARWSVGSPQRSQFGRLVAIVVVFGIVQVVLVVTYVFQNLWIGGLVGGLLVSAAFQTAAIRKAWSLAQGTREKRG